LANLCTCRYCQHSFQLCLYRPQQSVCGQPDCQARRRRDYHRRKLETDPEYRQTVRNSQKKWRDAHPGYCRQYRQGHPGAAERNRQAQQRRDQKRRIQHLAKNNLALDLKRSVAEIWLLGPGVKALAKNNVASAQIFIFQTIEAPQPQARAS
jgi:hypothetical protein